MTKNAIADVLKFSSPNIIYVITWNNLLKKLFCPFKVRVLNNIGELKANQIVLVEAVKVDLNIRTVFIINSKPYYYNNFEILID